VIGLAQDHIGRPIIMRFIRAVPARRIDLRRQCILLVTATGAADTYKFGAQARAMVGHACGAPRPGCDLTALDPICPGLSRDHHRQDCDCVKKLEFSHAFSLDVTDPYAGYLIDRLAFEARYSGARQYFFESRSRLRDREYGVRVWFALQATILSFRAADLAHLRRPKSERGLSCGFEIDHKLELGGKHDRTIARLLALENPPHINGRQKISSSKVGP
jgi:hypothetical protein